MHFESLAPNNNNYSLLKRIMDSPAAPALHINVPPIAPAKVAPMVPITALAAKGIPAAPKKKISEPVIQIWNAMSAKIHIIKYNT